MKRILVFLLVLGAALATLVSCGQQAGAAGDSIAAYDPAQSYTVSIGLYGDLEAAYKEVFASADFKAKFPNITIEYQTSDFGGHHNRLTTVLAANEATNDIEALEVGYIAQFVAGGGLSNLAAAPFNGVSVGSGLVSFAMANATTTEGALVAMPVDIAPAVMFYREDLVRAAGVDPREIENARNWDDILAISERLKAAGQIAFPHPNDVAMVPLSGGKGGWFVNNQPLEPKAKFMGALELVKEIRDRGVDADYGAWSGPWVEGFANGDVALMVNGAWFGGALRTWMAPDITDWRITYLPGKAPAALGGTYLGIPEQVPADKKAVAWEIIKYLTTSENAQLTVFRTIDAYPALVSTYTNPVMNENVPYFGNKPVRQIFADVAQSMPNEQVSEYDATALAIWGNAVTGVITGELGVEEAYNEARSQIIATIQ
ncbi:MAG: carbohydrate ABC transporter substrate-binding protein [Spirochaetales bacterium]|nr:carbohydrate ABC transporter substrate-binding protein [Spirochaetales bacterium]